MNKSQIITGAMHVLVIGLGLYLGQVFIARLPK